MANVTLAQLLRKKMQRDEPLGAPVWVGLGLVFAGIALGVFGAVVHLYSVAAVGAVLIIAAPYVRWRGGNG
jgi:hypothetical protein